MSIIDITDRCNLNCVYCCRGKGAMESTDPENNAIINAIKQIIQLRGTFVVLQGGEPSLKHDAVDLLIQMQKIKPIKPGHFLSLIRELINAKLTGNRLTQEYMKCLISQNLPLYCLTTNGMIYSDELESALFDGAFYLEVSLDGPNEESNKKTRIGISFDRVVFNVQKYAQRLPVEISCTITENNVDLLPEMIPFARSLDCVCLKLSPVIMIGCRDKPDSLWAGKYLQSINNAIDSYGDELQNILLKVKIYPYYLETQQGKELHNKLLKTNNIILENHECSALKKVKDIYIDTKMNVYGCASMKNEKELIIGNLKEKTLREIWRSAEREKTINRVLKNKLFQRNTCCTCTAVAYSKNKHLLQEE